MKPHLLAVLALIALLSATPIAAETTDAVSTAQAFVEAMNSGDPGAAAALFSEGGSIRTPRELHQGAAAVRAWIEDIIDKHTVISPIGEIQVSDGRATWTATVVRDDWLGLGIPSIDTRYEATVWDEGIAELAFTFDPEQEAQLRAAQAAARQAGAPPTDTSQPAAAPLSPAAPASDPLPALDAGVGAPPAAGWTWAVMKHTNGNHEVLETLDRHDFAWGFFAIRGADEIGGSDGSTVMHAGEAMLIRAGQEHTHHYAPRSEVLGFRLGSANNPPGSYHGGVPLFLSKPLEAQPGADYAVRVRDFALAPGERAPESATAEPNFVYVIEGTLTSRSSGDVVTVTEAGEIGTLPLNANNVLGNEGTSPLRFVLVDVHQ